MKKIRSLIFIILSCVLFPSTQCDFDEELFNVQFINNSGSDIRLFEIDPPSHDADNGKFNTYTLDDYKLKNNDTINIYYPAFKGTDYVIHLYVISEKSYIEQHKDKDYEEIAFDKYYLLRYDDFKNGVLIIKYQG